MQNVLQQLKGARLSTYVALALNESEICLGRGKPLSIHDIAAQMGLSPRSILRAVQDLAAKDFVTAAPELGARREKLYRVSESARSGHAPARRAASPQRPRTRHDTPARAARATTTRVPTAHRKRQTDPDEISRSSAALAPVSSIKSKIVPDKLSGFTTATVPAPDQKPRTDADTRACVSRPSSALAPVSSTKSEIASEKLSRWTRTRVPEPANATVSTPHRKPRIDPDKISGSSAALAPVFNTKSQIAPDTQTRVSRSAQSLTRTRTRTRTRARVVVVSTSSRSLPEYVLQQQQHSECRAIFAAAHVEGRPLARLAGTVDATLAQEWTDRLGDAPESFRDPVGFMIKHLLDDPTEAPPYAWQKPKINSLFDADFARFVHGRPEHTQYCREHPDEVDCRCGE